MTVDEYAEFIGWMAENPDGVMIEFVTGRQPTEPTVEVRRP